MKLIITLIFNYTKLLVLINNDFNKSAALYKIMTEYY